MILTSDKPVLCTENLVAQRCQGYVVLLLLLQCNIASEGEWGVDCSQTSVSSQLTPNPNPNPALQFVSCIPSADPTTFKL